MIVAAYFAVVIVLAAGAGRVAKHLNVEKSEGIGIYRDGIGGA